MDWLNTYCLSLLVFMPLLFGFFLLLINNAQSQKILALIGSLTTFLFSIYLTTQFDFHSASMQFSQNTAWLDVIGAGYRLGIDSISLWMVLLTTFLVPLSVLFSFGSIKSRIRDYYFFLMFLESAMIGVFLAQDLFLFYVFWEAVLIPMYFLIGIWGGKDRVFAAMKFFIFTLVGSLLMLVAIFYLSKIHQVQFGNMSLAFIDLYRLKLPFSDACSAQSLVFWAFALAFAVKVPLFPLHTWLPDAHVQAPTAGSVILAGVLLKMGGYGFIRIILPLFPQAVHANQLLFMFLSAAAVVFGAAVAMVQTDIKKLVAYSSVSHMGYVMLGLMSLQAEAVTGAVFQMISHGISTGALFLLVGIIYERRHTREITEFGGLCKVMPQYAVVFLIITLSSIALPLTNGFIGEFLILLGSWKTSHFATLVASTGVVLGAIYMLWVYQRMMFGPITHDENKALSDLSVREKVILFPLVGAVFVMGLFPGIVLESLNPIVTQLLSLYSYS